MILLVRFCKLNKNIDSMNDQSSFRKVILRNIITIIALKENESTIEIFQHMQSETMVKCNLISIKTKLDLLIIKSIIVQFLSYCSVTSLLLNILSEEQRNSRQK